MKKGKYSFNRLIYNNRFVMFFSLILAILIWLIVAIQFSPPEERIVKDVPVKIEMSQNTESFDLQVFGITDFKVDVTVSGKRYVVAQNNLTADDLIVTANTNYVDSAGKYSLKLDIKKKTQNAEFTISKLSNEYIEVYFDTYKEGEYPLTPEIIAAGKIIPEGYYKDTEILSAKTVTVSGPATEINKISKIFARITVDKELTVTKTLKAEIVPLGEYGSILRYLTVNNGNADISMTIPVYKIAELPATVTFKNIPAYFINNPLKYSITPAKATFGIDETLLPTTKEVNISTIDFSTIKSGTNVISVKSNTLKQVKVLDNTEVFKISIDAAGMNEKRFSVLQANISLINVNTKNAATIKSKGISNITVVGPLSVIQNLTAADIFAEIDFENKIIENGTVAMPARLYVKNYDNCWVYGQYSADIVIS